MSDGVPTRQGRVRMRSHEDDHRPHLNPLLRGEEMKRRKFSPLRNDFPCQGGMRGLWIAGISKFPYCIFRVIRCKQRVCDDAMGEAVSMVPCPGI